MLVGCALDHEDEVRGVVRDANGLGHDQPLLRTPADALLIRVAADALRKHQDRLTPRALRVLTQLTELGLEASK